MSPKIQNGSCLTGSISVASRTITYRNVDTGIWNFSDNLSFRRYRTQPNYVQQYTAFCAPPRITITEIEPEVVYIWKRESILKYRCCSKRYILTERLQLHQASSKKDKLRLKLRFRLRVNRLMTLVGLNGTRSHSTVRRSTTVSVVVRVNNRHCQRVRWWDALMGCRPMIGEFKRLWFGKT